MYLHQIEDWDSAYANGVNIPGGDRWPQAWVEPAKLARDLLVSAGRAQLDLAYGNGERNRFDLFMPEGEPRGLVVFVHGGFWMRLDKRFWSHLAAGPLAHGYAVAMPSYTLTPDIRVAGITREVGHAIDAAAKLVPGPILLVGHSAGGHLVSRMISETSPLDEALRKRIRHTVSVSGLHDLRPILRLSMNDTIRVDDTEAQSESPALLRPMDGARLTCWVGGAERSEFVRQNALLASIWTGLGAATATVVEPDRHHFNILDGLMDARHPLTLALVER
jgi:arylformamidase